MKNSSADAPYLSVIIAVYNEVENLPLLLESLSGVLETMSSSYEIIAVDDGSTDGSDQFLKKEAANYPYLRAVLLRRNYGQTAAFAAGFRHALGQVIVTMDGDLQNDPSDIPSLLAKLEEGYDLVTGWRQNRQDSMLTRIVPSQIANGIISRVFGLKLHDCGCSLKAFRSEIVSNLHLYGELHRFIPILAYVEGARVAEIPVRHHARRFGHSKYGIKRVFSTLMDLLTVFFLKKIMTRPMHLFGLPGIFCLISGIFIGAYMTLLKLGFHQAIGHRPLLLLSVLLVLAGVQLFCFGILAELLMRIYHESQHKPIYGVKEVIEA
ncbi:MAG: glycosyltransferase family 2 protein [Candidatus Omnitrophica bacterium]|nr:glycosyltransferase family 2 protein [Candidatus Omnitrophota bacterium]